jgi:hypothetical protein
MLARPWICRTRPTADLPLQHRCGFRPTQPAIGHPSHPVRRVDATFCRRIRLSPGVLRFGTRTCTYGVQHRRCCGDTAISSACWHCAIVYLQSTQQLARYGSGTCPTLRVTGLCVRNARQCTLVLLPSVRSPGCRKRGGPLEGRPRITG